MCNVCKQQYVSSILSLRTDFCPNFSNFDTSKNIWVSAFSLKIRKPGVTRPSSPHGEHIWSRVIGFFWVCVVLHRVCCTEPPNPQSPPLSWLALTLWPLAQLGFWPLFTHFHFTTPCYFPVKRGFCSSGKRLSFFNTEAENECNNNPTDKHLIKMNDLYEI